MYLSYLVAWPLERILRTIRRWCTVFTGLADVLADGDNRDVLYAISNYFGLNDKIVQIVGGIQCGPTV